MSIRKDKRAKNQPTWILDFLSENGIRKRIRVHASKSVAETKYGLILNEIEKRKMGHFNGNQYINLSELVQMYLQASETDGKSPLTIRRIINSTDAFMRLLGEDRMVAEIEPQLIEEYKRIRLTEMTPKKKLLTNGGLNTELRGIKAMFNWALQMRIISVSPFLGVKLVQTNSKPIRFLSSTELKAIYSAINTAQDMDASDLFTFYLQTGARRSEILPPKFTWANTDLERGTIMLHGKKDKYHTLPLSPMLINILKRREPHKYPFDFKPYQVDKIIRKYYRRAGISNASIHTLRKTCGSLLIQNGVDIYRVSKWLGHSSVAVTEKHYVDLLQSEYDDIAVLMSKSAVNYLPT